MGGEGNDCPGGFPGMFAENTESSLGSAQLSHGRLDEDEKAWLPCLHIVSVSCGALWIRFYSAPHVDMLIV